MREREREKERDRAGDAGKRESERERESERTFFMFVSANDAVTHGWAVWVCINLH